MTGIDKQPAFPIFGSNTFQEESLANRDICCCTVNPAHSYEPDPNGGTGGSSAAFDDEAAAEIL